MLDGPFSTIDFGCLYWSCVLTFANQAQVYILIVILVKSDITVANQAHVILNLVTNS